MIQYPNNSLSLLGNVKTIKCFSKVLLSQMIFLVILMAKWIRGFLPYAKFITAVFENVPQIFALYKF